MADLNTDIDNINAEVSKLMDKMLLGYSQLDVKLTDDPLKVVAWIGFHLGRDYYKGAELALASKRLLSASSLVRTAIENIADIFYIYCTPGKTDKYASAYITSISVFTEALNKAAQQKTSEIFASRAIKQVNPWTSASIEDRVKATGGALTATYDLLSYFSHPNPAAITYLGNRNLKNGQLNLVSQGNCVSALFLMAICLNHSDIKLVSREDLDAVAHRLGTRIAP